MYASTQRHLVDAFRRQAFTPPVGTRAASRMGAEIEFIPVDARSGQRCPIVVPQEIDRVATPATLPMLQRVARREGWRERPSPYGAPVFEQPSGGVVSYEPGGQIEYSAPPCSSVTTLVAWLRATAAVLRSEACDAGIELLTVGIDPYNGITDVSLQLRGHRYTEMDAYLATRGPAGARMMRQTAAFQATLDAADDPVAIWHVLSAGAPYVTALFANSSRAAGAPTGAASARAQTWRTLDPARTGLPAARSADPATEYVAFALAAPAILRRAPDGTWQPFGLLMDAGIATDADWAAHLTTLFPEVRPRQMADGPTFEIRGADTVPPEWVAAPLVFLAGITYDRRARAAAGDLLGDAQPALLARAARLGMRDREIGPLAAELFTLGLQGAARLGSEVVGGAELEVAHEFAAQYPQRGRSLADAGDAVKSGGHARIAGGVHATTHG